METGGAGSGGEGAVSGAGTGGMSGAAGSAGAPSGGNAGASGSAGSAGSPGGPYPECETKDDCVMRNDCCGCRSEPANAPGFCALPCERDACAEDEIDPSEVACLDGRCVIARRCDGSAGCPSTPPECPEGTFASVVDGCWGACLPATECIAVRSCAACGDAFCVEFQGMSTTYSCVTRVDTCDKENYCECLGILCGECSAEDDSVECVCAGC
jgi:hypothetical protein